MLHILATIYFTGTLVMVVAGIAMTVMGDWQEIRRALTGDDARTSARPWPTRVRRTRSVPLQPRVAPLRAVA